MLGILQEGLGYKVHCKVLNSMTHANVPQNRERIFIVGFHPSQVPDPDAFRFPEPLPLTRSIRELIDEDRKEEKYYYREGHPYYPVLRDAVRSWDTVYQWRRVYVRENQRNVCPTLTANMGTGGHNVPIVRDAYGIRKLTPRECARFQGYPDSFRLPEGMPNGKLYQQIGNSVTVPLIARIAAAMKETIGGR
jgi:DNA (cytosine-5)-methyltransferase 1